jgi:hypothetical protein
MQILGKQLKDWVDAPYGAFAKAVRESVDPEWGLGITASEACEWEVQVDYSYSGRGKRTFTVMAHDEKEAKKLAMAEFDKDTGSLDFWDAEVDDAEVRWAKQTS